MKRSTFKKSSFVFLLLPLCSCVTDDEFEVPAAAVAQEVQLETSTTLDAVLGSYYQNRENIDVATFEKDLVMEAYVVSSDETGNFYKELILQDEPENPKAGIAVQINLNSYFQTFDFGRKVYVNLKGLSIGELNGVVALGLANGKTIEQIPLARVQEHLIRTSEVAEIIPLPLKAIEFNDRRENLWIQLDQVQFSRFHINPDDPFTYASEDNDEFDGERLLESCVGDFPVILSTSTYADFKSLELPASSGSLKGILTRDFYDEFFTVYLNHPDHLIFMEENRCDPVLLDCGVSENHGSTVLFQEDFEDQKNNSPVTGNGWTNHVAEGSESWEGFTATGTNASLSRSARVRPAGSGDRLTQSWLITPALNFDGHTGEVLSFKTSTSFANHSLLEVLFSNTWNGDPEAFSEATWETLSSAYVAKRTDFFGDWISSGNVDLSCAQGTGYIAFKFTGSDLSNYDGIYELDDILITAN